MYTSVGRVNVVYTYLGKENSNSVKVERRRVKVIAHRHNKSLASFGAPNFRPGPMTYCVCVGPGEEDLEWRMGGVVVDRDY